MNIIFFVHSSQCWHKTLKKLNYALYVLGLVSVRIRNMRHSVVRFFVCLFLGFVSFRWAWVACSIFLALVKT